MEGFIIMSIPILYRDSSLVICEKPVGIPSESPGLPDLLHDEIGQNVWPVHRLQLFVRLDRIVGLAVYNSLR